jgi:hypothetical protein
MRSHPLSVRELVSSVSIEYLPKICDPIMIHQVFSQANVVFSGIGMLLLVSIILDLSVWASWAIMTLKFIRQLKM